MASKLKKYPKSDKAKDSFFQKPTRSAQGSDSFFITPSSSSGRKENEKTDKKEKKPFDKRRWRLQKYSRKVKLENWENKTNKATMYRYHKERKRDKDKPFDVKKIYDEEEQRQQGDDNKEDRQVEKKQRSGFKTIHEQYLDKLEEKKRRKEELLKQKVEKEKRLEEYKKKKIARYKKLNKKTKKGQPVMKDRMEYLLEKIQESINK